jgi:hypothetical protein
MRNELNIYRDARGYWRVYWLAQLPALFAGCFLLQYGHYIGRQDFLIGFGYISLGLSFIFQFAGFFHLLGFRIRILNISDLGLILYIDPFYKNKKFAIGWDEIANAKISGRKHRSPGTLLPYFGPAIWHFEGEKDVLVLDLKSPLPSHVQDLINSMKKPYFFRGQIECSKDGKEFWIAERPAGGHYRLLSNIQRYLSAPSKEDIQNSDKKTFVWYISLLFDLILASSVLVLNYFALKS